MKRERGGFLAFALCAGLALGLRAGALSGQVVYTDGSPARGAVVYAIREGDKLNIRNNAVMGAERLPRALTDKNGEFTLDLPAGRDWALLARDMEDRCGLLPALNPAGPATLLIPRPSELTGHLLAGPEPIPGETVEAWRLGECKGIVYHAESVTGKDGAFRFPELMGGEYVVQTRHSVPQVGCCFRSVVTKREIVELEPGTAREIRLGGTTLPCLGGRITDSDGAGLHGVWVRLQDTAATCGPEGCALEPVVWSAVTERDGTYTIYDIPPGEYTLQLFRRLARNSASRTLSATQDVTIADWPSGSGADGVYRNTCDVSVNLYDFTPLVLGQPAPPLKAQLLNGGQFDLDAEQGKIVVVQFSASWCSACGPALAATDAMAREFSAKDVSFVAISLDESQADCAGYVSKEGLKLPVVYGGAWDVSALREAYRVTDVPSSFIIGRDGEVLQRDLFGQVLHDFVARHVAAEAGSTP